MSLDAANISTAFPIDRLAHVLSERLGSDPVYLPGTMFNLWNGERTPGGGLVRWIEGHLCVGFVSWGRISRARAIEAERDNIRVLPMEWYEADGPIVYCTEALAFRPRIAAEMIRIMSALPGSTHICCWRHGDFRMKPVRRPPRRH
jgi:hypothetical protein